MNITDIDDKTIRRSQEQDISRSELTQTYTDLFFTDLKKLGVMEPDTWKPISAIIPEMVHMIQVLLDKKYAYLADDGSIYFSIKQYQDYGQLAQLDVAGMKSSVRINNDEYDKESVADFALWKGYGDADGPNFWNENFTIDGVTHTCK